MTVRGPTARRGLQFCDTPRDEILRRQEDARARLRQLDWLVRNPGAARMELDEYRRLEPAQRALLRRETLDLLTDLRAELRRRDER